MGTNALESNDDRNSNSNDAFDRKNPKDYRDGNDSAEDSNNGRDSYSDFSTFNTRCEAPRIASDVNRGGIRDSGKEDPSWRMAGSGESRPDGFWLLGRRSRGSEGRREEEESYPTRHAGWRKGGYRLPRRGDPASEELYPNCDVDIWMRSCEEEVTVPLRGKTTGVIPHWIKGTLLRNGPGLLQVGETSFKHLFDCSALLHRFAINEGKVTYQCRFLQSKTFLKNMAANRIIVTEFGTKAVPDPCQSIFSRVSALFNPGEFQSDNAMISIYPFGDEYYAFTETPVIHKIDPKTLMTLERVNLAQKVGIVSHTSHPHVLEDGTVFNIGMAVGSTGPKYTVFRFPPPPNWKPKTMEDSVTEEGESNGKVSDDGRMEGETKYEPFGSAEAIGGVGARWPLHPGYMHSFGITDNYFVIIEQPLSISVAESVRTTLLNEAMAASFRWYQDKPTLLHLLHRKTGRLYATYTADSFFYLHVINSYEVGIEEIEANGEQFAHVVIDICCYHDPSMLDCMYVEALKGAQQNPDYASLFHGRPLRFKLPLHNPTDEDNNQSFQFTNGQKTDPPIHVYPEQICDLGCETPRINYENNLGKKYRYFYAISSDVNIDNPGTMIKVDLEARTTKTWGEKRVFPSEPIFVPSPNAKSEDDGVVISALVWGKEETNKAGLLVLDAKTWTELGRVEFQLPGPAPKCLHGWFAPGLV